ncbi:phage tail protein [Cobetia amphilecti]|uniref:Phage tail protein n=1 Tax=Cobetia amphilecti TaxID=1055104 RepID=A0ABT6UWH8_9GAMM|nr:MULTISPECIES: phage tail protein [Cobetia]MBS4154955.1 phage tail protein [Cobetia sp. MC34]MDH2299837.1 phage tail protein [Cobetia sp. 29-18-1]MDI5886139.1 phage tail protein [Cobetia amphilecti]
MAATSLDLRDLEGVADAYRLAPKAAAKAAQLALNSAARRARTLGSAAIRQQVALSAGYVNDNLKVRTFATSTDLTTRIAANPRAVLLTRYGAKIRTVKAKGRRGLTGDPARGIQAGRKAAGTKGVKIKTGGGTKRLAGAFWVRLAGSGQWAPVVRTGDGRNDYRVLYGPSVLQVWSDVRSTVAPQAMQHAADEFIRQFDRLS